jgi:hypothetical protein
MNFRLLLRTDGHWLLLHKGKPTAAGRSWSKDAIKVSRDMRLKYHDEVFNPHDRDPVDFEAELHVGHHRKVQANA